MSTTCYNQSNIISTFLFVPLHPSAQHGLPLSGKRCYHLTSVALLTTLPLSMFTALSLKLQHFHNARTQQKFKKKLLRSAVKALELTLFQHQNQAQRTARYGQKLPVRYGHFPHLNITKQVVRYNLKIPGLNSGNVQIALDESENSFSQRCSSIDLLKLNSLITLVHAKPNWENPQIPTIICFEPGGCRKLLSMISITFRQMKRAMERINPVAGANS